jgi:hypothetical protein
MLHTYLHLRAALTRKTKKRNLGTFQKEMLFQSSEALVRKFVSLVV